jgi:hypothetical protein
MQAFISRVRLRGGPTCLIQAYIYTFLYKPISFYSKPVGLISLWVGMGWVETIKIWNGVSGRRELICYGMGWVRGGFSPISRPS